MIELRDVTVRTRGTLTPALLSNINLRIEERDRIALLGLKSRGLDLIVNVICGANGPEVGTVSRTSKISWPIPASSFLHKHQSVIANARFIARLYEVDQASFIAKVLEFADVEDIAHEQLSRCAKSAASRLGFALGACLPFDMYLLTSTSIGEKQDRPKYEAFIEELAGRSGLIIATGNIKAAQAYCDKAFVLDPAGSVYYEDMEAAGEHFARLMKKAGPQTEVEEEEQDERSFDDFF